MKNLKSIDQSMEKSSQRCFIKPALSEDLVSQVLASDNIKRAWNQVKSNKGAPGVDGVTINDFPAEMVFNWPNICRAIREGKYHPSPVKRVEIPKRNGKKRPLGIPTIQDRVIQQAIAQVLTPIFDPGFSELSFGFRPGRSAHQAVYKVQEYLKEGYKVCVDIDLANFFDRVNHDILMSRLSRRVSDKNLLRLIGKYLRSGVEVDGTVQPTREGVPQGGPLSPLLSNIMLDDLDKELDARGHRYARYADDFVILVKTPRAGERVLEGITQFLEQKLKLQVNGDKSKVAKANQCVFLGFTFKGTRIYWSDEAFSNFQYWLKRYTSRSWGVSMEYRITKLNEYIIGWMNYYGISEYYSPVENIDGWLRRRIRCCFWKRWRYVRTKVRELLKLGTPKRTAILTALSRKGPWCLSRTLATQTGMTNKWLHTTLGLANIRSLWISLHYSS